MYYATLMVCQDDGTVVYLSQPWEVDPIPEPCPVCGAEGPDQSCSDGERLIDDHAERGGPADPMFDAETVVSQHPDL